jgi:hypothetical protein
MYHKTRLYLLSCSDKSCMSFIKVYAKLREITNEGKKLGGKRGRDRAHSCIYDDISLGALVVCMYMLYMMCMCTSL